VSSVPPSETQVTNTGSFVVCCGIANESAEALTTPFTGSRCLGFEFEITERQPFGIGIPWFQAYLDGGVATRPFTLNGPAGTLDVVPSAKRFALDTESTVITVGGSETPPERIQRFVDVRDELETRCEMGTDYPGTRDAALRRTSDRSRRGVSYRGTHGTAAERDPPGVIRHHRSLPETVRVRARLWRAVFPTVVALAFVAVGVGGIAL